MKALRPETGRVDTETPAEQASPLNIVVIFTSLRATIFALKKAGDLAENLGGRITLLVPQIVPYPLPLTCPPVSLDFQEKRFTEIAAGSSVDICVQLYLCRDEWETLKAALQVHSLVVLGLRRRWWPSHERTLARKLRRAGHEVVVVDMSGRKSPR